ncbi:SAMHD1 [Bugula neritina]|uniref:SAMHD1 n=1 Tax=Bugula neritina TaxID=10212 RepID=A0A7J7J756_BUGNE|nr:SAMHD1 [Bugula neritina]
MLDYMYTMNNNQLKQELQVWNITEQDWEFIKSLIICEPCERATGRGENKLFLYDIVANKESGNDVDKWDYLLRDSHYLGLKHSFDYERILHYSKVIQDDNGRPHICVRDKMVDTIYQLYYTRYNLHKHGTLSFVSHTHQDLYLTNRCLNNGHS